MKYFLAKMKAKILKKWNELLNDPAGPHVVALSFAIGVLSLMLTLPTLGLAFLLMLAIIKWTKHSMTAALIGYFFTKLIAFPLAPLELMIGKVLLHENFNPHGHKWSSKRNKDCFIKICVSGCQPLTVGSGWSSPLTLVNLIGIRKS
jgi:uncharacterized protein (DUF2062 family)